MNNTSRFKFYGILAAALIVAAGVVWFYPSKGRSGKVRSVKTVVTVEQAKTTPSKSTTASTGNGTAKAKPKFTYAKNPTSIIESNKKQELPFNKIQMARILKLSDEEADRAYAVLEDTSERILEQLFSADRVTVTEMTEKTIVFKAGMSDEQSEAIEREFYKELFQIVGAERWKLYDADPSLDAGLRTQAHDFGRGNRTYTVIGREEVEVNIPLSPENAAIPLEPAQAQTKSPPLASAWGLFIHSKIEYSDGRIEQGWGATGPLNYPAGYKGFRESGGKFSALILTFLEEQKNRFQ